MGPNSTGMNLYCIELGDDSNELGGSFCGKWIPGGAFSLRSIRYGVWFPDLKMQTEIFSPAGRCLVDNKEVELGSAKKKEEREEEEDEVLGSFRVVLSNLSQLARPCSGLC